MFRDKPAGLIVDYIGIGQSLKKALGQYSASDRRQAGIDEAEALDWILEQQHKAAAQETEDESKKLAHRRFQDAVLALSKAFALAAASDAARAIREEVAFFQTIRAALTKTSIGGKKPRRNGNSPSSNSSTGRWHPRKLWTSSPPPA